MPEILLKIAIIAGTIAVFEMIVWRRFPVERRDRYFNKYHACVLYCCMVIIGTDGWHLNSASEYTALLLSLLAWFVLMTGLRRFLFNKINYSKNTATFFVTQTASFPLFLFMFVLFIAAVTSGHF